MRAINLTVDNEYIQKNSNIAGAAGSGNAVELRISFDSTWDGLAKNAYFTDATGQTSVVKVLTIDERGTYYKVVIPFEPLKYAGDMTITLKGHEVNSSNEISKCVVSARTSLKVLEADDVSTTDPGNSVNATVAEQLEATLAGQQAYFLEKATAAANSATAAAGSAASAESAKADAIAAKTAAETAKTNAQSSAATASTEATNAAASAIAAEESATTATTKAGEASTSAANAASSAGNAATSASVAVSAKTDAVVAKTAAETAKSAAESAKTSAETANANAQTARTEANNSAATAAASASTATTSAATASDKASLSQSWAVGGTGTRAGEDTNNAKYWSEQAQQIVGGDFATKMEAQGYVDTHNSTPDAHSAKFAAKADLISGKVPASQLPTMDYEPTGTVDAHNTATDAHSAKFAAKADLISGKVPASQLPSMDSNVVSSGGFTTTNYANVYSVTIDGVTQLVKGLTIVVIPNATSTSANNVKLNLNGLGAKDVNRYPSSSQALHPNFLSNSWFVSGVPYILTYNGAAWIAVTMASPDGSDIYGKVPIQKGGTNATTAEAALTNLGAAAKVTGATAGNLAGLDANGDLTDSGKSAASFESAGSVNTHNSATDAHSTLFASKANLFGTDMVSLTVASPSVVGEHAGKMLICDYSGAMTITVLPWTPQVTNWTVGTEVEIFRKQAGTVTITPGTGVTILSAATSPYTIADRYTSVFLKCIEKNVWVLQGNLG